ncbi:MAG: hypothetical protein SOX17_02690 [Prevotella sp.]|nr:hypothetical protein [Prevotella sp.]MDD7605242.1 hypothetical protein [Prevotellaceae bacterium]MDY3247391.1 hypothetical protein [Prevotella sp.]
MKKINYKPMLTAAPYVMGAGMACFVAAYMIGNPWIKDTLLLTGLVAVILSTVLYAATWKNERR